MVTGEAEAKVVQAAVVGVDEANEDHQLRWSVVMHMPKLLLAAEATAARVAMVVVDEINEDHRLKWSVVIQMPPSTLMTCTNATLKTSTPNSTCELDL